MLIIDTHEVHDLAADISGYCTTVQPTAELIVAKVAHDINAVAQKLAPVDTGALKNSITSTVSGLDAEIGPTVEYGGWVEEGTDGPYVIPNAFGYMLFVEHPGIDPQPYMGPAFDMHEPFLEEALGQLGERILK